MLFLPKRMDRGGTVGWRSSGDPRNLRRFSTLFILIRTK
jgi:hypothetical protein